MTWGERQAGGAIPFPALLYTQRLAQSQMAGFGEGRPVAPAAGAGAADFMAAQAAIADIVADHCPGGGNSSAAADEGKEEDSDDSDDEEEEEEEEHRSGRERVCCGEEKHIPGWCFLPEYLHLRLRQYYPAVSFFVHETKAEEKGTTAQLRKLSV